MSKLTLYILLVLTTVTGLGCHSIPQRPAGSSRCLRVYSAADYQVHQVIDHWYWRHAYVADIVDKNIVVGLALDSPWRLAGNGTSSPPPTWPCEPGRKAKRYADFTTVKRP